MNELKINIPEGHIIDKDNTNLEEGIIKFKRKEISWEAIVEWARVYIPISIINLAIDLHNLHYDARDHIQAYCKLFIIAKYFNKNWNAKIGSKTLLHGYSIKALKTDNGEIYSASENISGTYHILGSIYFKDKESAEQAIKLIGDDIKYLF